MSEQKQTIVPYKGYVVNIECYASDEKFFDVFDSDFTLACMHRDYTLGNKRVTDDIKFFQELLHTEEEDGQTLKDRFEASEKYISLPLYIYDHSGISMSTSFIGDRWDTSQVGYIYITRAQARKNFQSKRLSKKLIAQIKQEMIDFVRLYSAYLSGEEALENFNFIVTDSKDKHVFTSECCYHGFSDEDAITEAKYIVDNLAIYLA